MILAAKIRYLYSTILYSIGCMHSGGFGAPAAGLSLVVVVLCRKKEKKKKKNRVPHPSCNARLVHCAACFWQKPLHKFSFASLAALAAFMTQITASDILQECMVEIRWRTLRRVRASIPVISNYCIGVPRFCLIRGFRFCAANWPVF